MYQNKNGIVAGCTALVKATGIKVRVHDIYSERDNDSWDTTAGIYKSEELDYIDSFIGDYWWIGITFDSQHCTDLPVCFYELLVLDDRDKRLKILNVDFKFKEGTGAYIMEDGHISREVTL